MGIGLHQTLHPRPAGRSVSQIVWVSSTRRTPPFSKESLPLSVSMLLLLLPQRESSPCVIFNKSFGTIDLIVRRFFKFNAFCLQLFVSCIDILTFKDAKPECSFLDEFPHLFGRLLIEHHPLFDLHQGDFKVGLLWGCYR